MNSKSTMQRSLMVGVFAATVALVPVSFSWAEDQEGHEHEEGDCHNCGVVSIVQAVQQGSSGLTGAATGAVAGGALGNQVGQTETASSTIGGMATTILGAAAGALGGYHAEKAVTSSSNWNVTVHMDSGEDRTIAMTADPKVKVGDHVQVEGDKVKLYQHEED